MHLHNVWLDEGNKISERNLTNIALFRSLHHDATHHMIQGMPELPGLPGFMKVGISEILETPEIDASNKSDVLRYAMLFCFGGIYTDVDVRVIRPMHDLYNSCVTGRPVIAGWEDEKNLGTAVIIARPRCSLFYRCLLAIMDGRAGDRWGPTLMNPMANKGEIHDMPRETFYPLTYAEREDTNVTINLDQTYAIHTWDHSWAIETND